MAAAIAEPPPTAISDAELDNSPQSSRNVQRRKSTQNPQISATTDALQMPYAGQSPISWNPSLDPFLSLDNIGDNTISRVDLAAPIDPQLQCHRTKDHGAQRMSLDASSRTSECREMHLDKHAMVNGSRIKDHFGSVS